MVGDASDLHYCALSKILARKPVTSEQALADDMGTRGGNCNAIRHSTILWNTCSANCGEHPYRADVYPFGTCIVGSFEIVDEMQTEITSLYLFL